ncbi:hypothetical protein HID58_018580 [Brassica napus]|uniref:Pentatricopeptide repeat-containing protein n=1 Tax=Brassica napus TaxID=3708 RepID=A0ABQ8DAA9_BRANA|nr:hypothetical protein HID58_018580 [Brassica napus]
MTIFPQNYRQSISYISKSPSSLGLKPNYMSSLRREEDDVFLSPGDLLRRRQSAAANEHFEREQIQASSPSDTQTKPLIVHSLSSSNSLPSSSQRQPTNHNSTHRLVPHNPFLSLLQKCESLPHLKQIQAQMTITASILDPSDSSRLINFCTLSKSRNLDYCVKLLRGLDNPNAFSWNVTIKGFSESPNPKDAILIYKEMLRDGGESRPDHFTYPVLFKVCADLELSRLGLMILGHVLKLGLELVSHVHNASIHMLACFGEMGNARKVFDESPVRDVVSWNSLINGYKKMGQAEKAIEVYKEMESEGIDADYVTMIACSRGKDDI